MIGGKAINLRILEEAGLRVPPFGVVDTVCFFKFNDHLFDLLPSELTEANYGHFEHGLELHFAAIKEHPDLQSEVRKHLQIDAEYFAVRSSGSEEDGESSSFAGQFESYLFVKKEDILDMVVECWRSRFSLRALHYIENSKSDPRSGLAVIIQAMVRSEKSGVLVTANVDRREPFQTLISATYGVGEGLVSGVCEADGYTVSQESFTVLEKKITVKPIALYQGHEGGLVEEAIPVEKQALSVLSDAELKLLTEIGSRIEKLYDGRPQDIEWAFEAGELYILQTRPLTSWQNLNKSAEIELWDSSNIGESYHGQVSPLTFSFTRNNYHQLFRALLVDVGATEEDLEKSRIHLERLVGHYRGHLYYRLTHWKKILIPLPGGTVFMKFLSSFIGSNSEIAGKRNRGLDVLDAMKVLGVILGRYVFRDRFTAVFEKEYAEFATKNWRHVEGRLSEEELVTSINHFYDELMSFWKMPSYNDLFSVIWVGLFEKLVASGFRERSQIEQNSIRLSLIGASKGLGPIVELRKLASEIRKDPNLYSSVQNLSAEELTTLWGHHDELFSDLRGPLQQFLDQWGFRCEDELMLEATDLKEDPTVFFAQLKLQINLPETEAQEISTRVELKSLREWLLWPFIRAVAKRTKEHLDTRESMRIKRSELFAIMRRLVKALGRIWFADPKDIFYLHLEEISLEHRHKHRAIIQDRKTQVYEEAPERFYLCGDEVFVPSKIVNLESGISGTPCFGGIVEGDVVHYQKGMDIADMKNKILVTERSGPGHVAYFPHIKAMVVEKGSTLSHAVIAAREFGLPTIVGVEDLLARVVDGMFVQVNADTGEIILQQRQEQS